ncbi:MAG: SpoIIE family protein phosphatase [Gammaproteobacteria bacterium]
MLSFNNGKDVVAGFSLNILIVDDELSNLLLLKAILSSAGHHAIMARDGGEAVAAFEREQPDMVLMDVMMPGMDGYEATRQIKKRAGERFVPVIFLTALDDERALAKCVECGGDDFLTKPYSRVILQAKIDALARASKLHSTVKLQRDELVYHQDRILKEQEVAQKVFSNIMHSSSLSEPCIKYLLSPMALFNGDLLLAARKPSGGMRVMLGDFTGHGLSAAIGAIPVADIFYRMTAKGFSIGEIVTEINRKLRMILPPGLFCAACLLDLDPGEHQISAWNGGVPDVLVLGDGRGIHQRFISRHLPLGVVGDDKFDTALEYSEFSNGDSIYLYTDGVIEAWNPRGEMFGQARLEQFLLSNEGAENRFNGIRNGLLNFIGDQSHSDDITLIELTCDGLAAHHFDVAEQGRVMQSSVSAMEWQITLEFGPDILRNFDPLPLLIHMLMEIQGLRGHREHLYTIIAELFSNSLDHGLLGLDSALKATPHGFAEYYQLRARGLAALQQGRIRIDLAHAPYDTGGKLVIRVEDSGPGFDHQKKSFVLNEGTIASGRGIGLVRDLCDSIQFSGSGNIAEAVYFWRY